MDIVNEGKPINFESGELRAGDKINIHNYLNNEWKPAVVQEIDLGEREILVNYSDNSQEWISVDGRKICYMPGTVENEASCSKKKSNGINMMTRHQKNNNLKENDRKEIKKENPKLSWNEEEIAQKIREIVDDDDDPLPKKVKKETPKIDKKELKAVSQKTISRGLPFLRVKFKKNSSKLEFMNKKRERINQLRKKTCTSSKSVITNILDQPKVEPQTVAIPIPTPTPVPESVISPVTESPDIKPKEGKRVSILPKKYQDMERSFSNFRVKFNKNESSTARKKVKKPSIDTPSSKKIIRSPTVNFKIVNKSPLSTEPDIMKKDIEKNESNSFEDNSSSRSSPFMSSTKKKIKTLLPRRNIVEMKPVTPVTLVTDSAHVQSATSSPTLATSVTSIYPTFPSPQLNLSSSATEFICPKPDCKKQFRKENLLMMHIKHYHEEYRNMLSSIPNVADLAYARTVGENIDTPQSRFLHKIVQQEEDKLKEKPEDGDSEFQINTSSISFENSNENLLTPNNTYSSRLQVESHMENDSPKVSKKSTPKKSENSIPSTSKVPILLAQLNEPPLMSPSVSIKSDCNNDALSVAQDDLKLVSTPIKDKLSSNKFSSASVSELSMKRNGKIKSSVKKSNYPQMENIEVVNCTCGYGYEDGLMIRCDLCLCWQHAACNSVQKAEQVPVEYVCSICQTSRRIHSSKKYCYVQNWLRTGKLPWFNFSKIEDETVKARGNYLKESSSLLCSLKELKNALHCLHVKIHVLRQVPDHHKLYLWAKSWNIEKNDEKENRQISGEGPVPEEAINMAECRRNLCEHIDEEINKVESMLDNIEQQIDKLEENNDDEFNKEPEKYCNVVKQTLLMLCRDLSSIQNLRYCS